MVKNAMEWAKARNLVRTNPVHGKSEYKVPVLESFSHAETERTTQRAAASAILEDRCWYHLIFYMCFFQFTNLVDMCRIFHVYMNMFLFAWAFPFKDAQDLLTGPDSEITSDAAMMFLNCMF